MRNQITVGNRIIGENQPVFIMAECGVTCNYHLQMTKELIDVCSDAGADGIKFIFWFPDEIMSDRTVEWTYAVADGSKKTENMYEMVSKLVFTLEEWKEIKAYADSKNIIMFSTVNSPTGIVWAEELNLEAYKVSSWDFNYIPLWQEIAQIGKPMIIDTGPVNTTEVAKVLQIMKDAGNDQSILVHCYHTDDPNQMNMRTIPYMRKAFNSLVGFSAVGYDDEMDIVGVTLGSVFLEKRLTMRRDLPGHHHALSKEPEEFKEYVRMIRNVQASLGIEDLRPSKGDLQEKKKWFRHLVANEDIFSGTVLTKDMIACKRGQGIEPEHMKFFIGKELKRDLKENDDIEMGDV